VAADTPDDLKAQVAGDLVELEVADPSLVAEAAAKLQRLAERSVEVDGRVVRGRLARAGRALPGLLRELDRSGIDLDAIEVHRPTLDDVFLSLTGRSLRDADAAAEQPAAEGEPPAELAMPEGAMP
jgi:ABC-2 type transport system ATP-binding protein